jgi:hypothetical protein
LQEEYRQVVHAVNPPPPVPVPLPRPTPARGTLAAGTSITINPNTKLWLFDDGNAKTSSRIFITKGPTQAKVIKDWGRALRVEFLALPIDGCIAAEFDK